jgi:hypothetical protein
MRLRAFLAAWRFGRCLRAPAWAPLEAEAAVAVRRDLDEDAPEDECA